MVYKNYFTPRIFNEKTLSFAILSSLEASPFGYVTNSGSNTVSQIDLSTHTIVQTITVGNGPKGIVMSPDQKYVYVANTLSGTVSIIETSTCTVVGTIFCDVDTLGSIAISPDGKKLWVGSNLIDPDSTKSIKIIDTKTHNIADETTGLRANGAIYLAFSSEGNQVYCSTSTNSENGSINSYNSSSYNFITSSDLHGEPSQIAVSYGKNFFYTPISNNSQIAKINAFSLATQMIDLPSIPSLWGIAITYNDSFAYISSRSTPGVIYKLNLSNHAIIHSIAVGNEPGFLSITANGAYAYVPNKTSNSVSVIDLKTDTVIATISGFSSPYQVALPYVVRDSAIKTFSPVKFQVGPWIPSL